MAPPTEMCRKIQIEGIRQRGSVVDEKLRTVIGFIADQALTSGCSLLQRDPTHMIDDWPWFPTPFGASAARVTPLTPT
jgi:hypothetical protein